MAKNGDAKTLVAEWAKARKEVETAQMALDKAQAAAGSFAKDIFAHEGSEPFTVRALGGKKYRCIHKEAQTITVKADGTKTGRNQAESWHVIPVPENEAKNEY